MKKVNLNAKIVSLKNKPMLDMAKEPLTVGRLIANALALARPEKPIDGPRFYALSVKIFDAKGETELTEEEEMLVERVLNQNSQGYSSLMLGQVWKALRLEPGQHK